MGKQRYPEGQARGEEGANRAPRVVCPKTVTCTHIHCGMLRHRLVLWLRVKCQVNFVSLKTPHRRSMLEKKMVSLYRTYLLLNASGVLRAESKLFI